jgi:small subunit ribosomal protein S3
MGRKIHPIGFRLKINRDWSARWFAEGDRYRELLQEDFKIRQFVEKEAERAGIAGVEIERYPNQVQVSLFTAKPGIVIGRKGESVKKLRQGLEELTGKKVKVEVEEVEKPDLDSRLVALNIAGQLERRIGHSRAMKRAVTQAMRQGAKGIKIQVAAVWRCRNGPREWQMEARCRVTRCGHMGYGTAEALTTYGRLASKSGFIKEKLSEEPAQSAPARDVSAA